jgi:hypothetical protein
VLAQQLTGPVPSLRGVRGAVPEWVDRVVAKTLAKAPADRFATAAHLAAALVAPKATETVSALPAEKSIAVLPFANLSADPKNEFFADGMTDELINALAKVPGPTRWRFCGSIRGWIRCGRTRTSSGSSGACGFPDAARVYFMTSRISPAAAITLSTSRERALACWVALVRSPRTAATPAERSRRRSNRTF